MKQFEYKETLVTDSSRAARATHMESEGLNGWELVGVLTADSFNCKHQFFWKREKRITPSRQEDDWEWKCPTSPIGVCEYGTEGQFDESCVWCGQPEERK